LVSLSILNTFSLDHGSHYGSTIQQYMYLKIGLMNLAVQCVLVTILYISYQQYSCM